MQIPKIIHQIWSGVDEPLPSYFKELGETWKRDYPTWEYIIWDNTMMNDFVKKYYPQHWDIYIKYPYNVQRWDAIRYLILDKLGGMYVDFDYESIEPMNKIIDDKVCCFALESPKHRFHFNGKTVAMFNNALMLSIPNHPFMKKIIDAVFLPDILDCNPKDKNKCVLLTTGPWKLIMLHDELDPKEKEKIYLIPAKYVTPFNLDQAIAFRSGIMNQELEDCLEEAYAVHYFFSNWRKDNK